MPMTQTSFMTDGKMDGEIGEIFNNANMDFDPGLLRPYFDKRGNQCVTLNTGNTENRKDKDAGGLVMNSDGIPKEFPIYKKVLISDLQARGINTPVFNATSLRKDEWLKMDQVIIKTARQRLRAWADLAASSTFGGFNGWGKTVLEHETMSDPGEALVDMDGLSQGRTDQPKYQLEGLPLPVTHSDFFFPSRQLAASRNSGMPLDLTMGEAAARRVAESMEKTTIGINTGLTYGVTADYGRAPTVYGYTNFTDRNTKADMTAMDGTNGETIVTEWLAVRELLYAANHYGPYMVYTSSNQDQFLDNLFSTTEPSAGTLRKRLLEIDSVQGIKRLDYLTTDDTTLFVQMTADVARAVVGMPLNVVQWETVGGMKLNFKVMTISVPQLRADFSGNCGIAHATTA